MTTLIEADGVSAGYGPIVAIRDISLQVSKGEIVALLGANGSGKTTTLLTLAGVLKPTSGHIRLDGQLLKTLPHKRARAGLSFVPGGRTVFMGLTGEENLRLGSGSVAGALDIFPELVPIRHRRAGLLSGGEQQMISLARCLASEPRMLMIDELSLGLAPLVVRRLYGVVKQAAEGGTGVLLVEQHVKAVLDFVDRAYVMRRGRIELVVDGAELSSRLPEVERLYLPGGEETVNANS